MHAFLIQHHLISNVLFQFTVTYRIANILYYVHIYFFVSTSHNWMENNRKFRYKIVAIEACIRYLLSFREMWYGKKFDKTITLPAQETIKTMKENVEHKWRLIV